MISLPLVSIIIPTRNRKALLRYAIQSALTQTYPHIQLVIQDNNSQDGTQELIRSISDDRLEYFRSTEDLSMTDNWNRAFQYARGEYFLRLDDDNILANDFIEKALEVMNKNNFDLFIFSPLVVNLQSKISTLFTPENKAYTLDRFQEVYLEYFNFIDSNYVLYKMSEILKIFPDGKIYKTTLPDRYMNYCMVSKNQGLRIGMSTEIKGITRFDYRPPLMSDYQLSYVDYDRLDTQEILNLKDCLSNFHMHRANTLTYFLENTHSSEIKTFFEERITHPSLMRTLMKLGHIYMAREAYSWKEWVIYNRYVIQILLQLVSRPFAYFEGKRLPINILVLGWNACRANMRSFRNILMREKRKVMDVNPALGNKLVEEMLAGDMMSWKQDFKSEHGSFPNLLKRIRAMNGRKRKLRF